MPKKAYLKLKIMSETQETPKEPTTEKEKPKENLKIPLPKRNQWQYLATIFVFLVLLFFSLFIHEWKTNEVGYTAILGISGLILGAGIGYVISPKVWAKINFSKESLAIAVFSLGYLFSKIEGTIWFFFEGNILIKKPEFGVRMLIFIICLMMALMSMYAYQSEEE